MTSDNENKMKNQKATAKVKWTIKELEDAIKVNVKNYGSAIVVAALYKRIYGVFPNIGLSGVQAEYADQIIEVMPGAVFYNNKENTNETK